MQISDAIEPVTPWEYAPAPGTELSSHYDSCYGCGPTHPAGLHLQMTIGEGVSVHGLFEVTEQHQGAPGLAHGGLLSCAMDESVGSLGYLLGIPAVTARLETDFRMPVPVGTVLYLHAECLGKAGRKIYLQATARVNAPDGPIAVQSQALFLAVDLSHFSQHGSGIDVESIESIRINP